jgi:hypothetical protein
MKLATSLVILGTVAAIAEAYQDVPRPLKANRTSFTELIAYNYPGKTPQELWQRRDLVHNVKFDNRLRCFQDEWI